MARELRPEAERLNAITAKDYLIAKGWERVEGKKPDIWIFRRPGSEVEEVVLPVRSDFPDTGEAMARAVEEIARFEKRSAEQVLRDLARPRADRLRFGVEGRGTSDGGIGLDEGLALLSGSRKALLAAACSVKRPQRFYPRMSIREAEAFVRACKLGQTERGSFVATLECELEVEGAESLPQGDPFGRKVTTLLLTSMARLVDAIVADRYQTLMSVDQGEVIVSANLCEAVLEMMPSADDAVLRISSSWSPTLKAPQDVPDAVRVERRYCPAIEQISRALRPSASPTPDLFVGKVDALQGEPRPDGRMQGEIALTAQVDSEILKIRFDLGPDDYVEACDAHRDGHYVSVRGILRRGARVHRLDGAKGFMVVRG